MKLSIIIPFYNPGEYLKDCISSCMSQKGLQFGVDYEIIGVDDGSTDGSATTLNTLFTNALRGGVKLSLRPTAE